MSSVINLCYTKLNMHFIIETAACTFIKVIQVQLKVFKVRTKVTLDLCWRLQEAKKGLHHQPNKTLLTGFK